MSSLFPPVTFDRVDRAVADDLLARWGHCLGPCRRPFGVEAWALELHGAGPGPISVAVSASTVSATCGGMRRDEVVELARLCSSPDHRWATRVCLRLWREVAARAWAHWPARAAVSYSQTSRHDGHTYRLDGWRRVAEVPGSSGGGSWTAKRAERSRKVLWAFDLQVP